MIGCLIALCAAFFGGLAVVYLRKLADQIHFTLVPLYNQLGAALLAPIWTTISPVTKVSDLPIYGWAFFLMIIATVIVSFG